jgi:hypothetical protein
MATVPDGGVLLGNRDGTFQHASRIDPKSGNVFTGDFNGDGKPDLTIAQYSAYIYSGKGDGTFGSAVEISGCEGSTNEVVIQVGDFNRDGKTDILCGNVSAAEQR